MIADQVVVMLEEGLLPASIARILRCQLQLVYQVMDELYDNTPPLEFEVYKEDD